MGKIENMIEGVFVKLLKVFGDDRGSLMHMMREDDDFFKHFGEIYFSKIKPGVVKGWKKHAKMTQHFAVPVGKILLVIYDSREESSTYGQVQEITIGRDNYKLVRIPSAVFYSFKAIGDESALVANCTDLVHLPSESVNVDLANPGIPYKWDLGGK